MREDPAPQGPRPTPKKARPDELELGGEAATDHEVDRAQELVRLLRAIAASASSDGAAAEALHEISMLLATPIGDAEGALRAAEEAFRRAPGDFRHARALRKAAERAGAREPWATAVDAEIRGAPSPQYRVALALSRARTVEISHRDLEKARAAYEQVVELSPEPEALAALTRLCFADRALEPAARHAAGFADAITDPAAAAEYAARAARLQLLAGDREAARAATRAAVERSPTEPGVLHAQELTAIDADDFATVVDLRRRQVDGKLVPTAHGCFDAALVARYRLGDFKRAIALLSEALPLVEDAARLVVLEELTAVLEAEGEHERWAELAEERARLETTPARRAHLLVRVGRVRAEQLDDPEAALAALRAALEIDPCHGPALEAAGRLYAQLDRRADLVEMHRLEARAASAPADVAAASHRLGELLIENPKDLDEGIDALRAASEGLPDSLAVFGSLERALTAKQDWAGLRDLYATALEGAEPHRRHWLLLQIARLSADRLDDRGRAVSAYREASELGFEAPVALQPLRRLALILDPSVEDERPLLADTLRRLAAVVESPAEAASCSERLAALLERDGDGEAALQVLGDALESAPRSHPIQRAAGRALLQARRFQELAEFFDHAADQAEGIEKARWLHKAAAIWGARLRKPDHALQRLRAASALAPDDEAIGLTLHDLLEAQACWSDLTERLQADTEPRTCLRRGAFAEADGDHEGALSCYSKALDAGLELARWPAYRLLAELGRWAELSALYAEQSSSEPAQTLHARYRAGTIAAEHLRDPSTARGKLAEASQAVEDAIGPLLASLGLGEPSGEDSVRLLDAVAERTDDPKLRAALLRRRCAVLAALGSREDARDLALSLLTAQPDDPGVTVFAELELERASDRKGVVGLLRALDPDSDLAASLEPTHSLGLARALEELGAVREAADAYVVAAAGDIESPLARLALPHLYAAMNDDARLDESLGAMASVLPHGPLRAACFRVLAERRAQADDASGAMESYQSALAAHPLDFEALRALEALCVTAEDLSPVIDGLLRAFGATSDPPVVTQLGCHVGAMLVRENRLDAARETLERAHAVDGEHGPTLMLLVEVCERLGDFPAVAHCLDALIARPDTSEDTKLTALRKLVHVVLEELEDLERAAVAADAVCDLRPADDDALGMRLEVHRRAKNHVEMARTLDELVDLPGLSESARVEYLFELATIHEEKLDDAVAAIAALGSVRSAEHRQEAADRLLHLGESTGRWDLASGALVSALDIEGEMDVQWETTVRTRLAELFEGPLERRDDAIAQYRQLVSLDARNADALVRIISLLDDPTRSLEFQQLLFQVRPHDYQLLRGIRETFVTTDDEDAAFCAEAYMVGLRAPTEEEDYFYRQRRTYLGTPNLEEGLAPHLTVLAPVCASPWIEILNRLAPALTAVFPTDFRAYDVDPAAAEDASGPLTELLAELASFVGVERYHVHLAAPRIAPTVELVDGTPHVIVPRTLADATRREQQFVLGALLLRTVVGGYWSDPARANPLTPKYLGYVIDAVQHLTGGSGAVESPILKDILSRMETALGPELRAEVEKLLEAVSGEPPLDGLSLQRDVAVGAARAGILMCQDPAVAASAMRQWPAMFDFGDLDDSTKLPAPCVDALPFAVSAEHLELRRRFGLGVKK